MSARDVALHVTDERAAAFLLDANHRRFLDPFLGRECTVAQAARDLTEDVNVVLYRVRRMVAIGLLRVVRIQQRRGRAVKVYTSVAERLFVPYAATPALNLLDALRRDRAATEELFVSALARVMQGAHDEGS